MRRVAYQGVKSSCEFVGWALRARQGEERHGLHAPTHNSSPVSHIFDTTPQKTGEPLIIKVDNQWFMAEKRGFLFVCQASASTFGFYSLIDNKQHASERADAQTFC